MKNVLKPLDKSVLIPLGLAAAAAAIDAAIQKKIFGSGMTTLLISNEEIVGIMKIVKSLEGACLLIKLLAKQLKTKQRTKGWITQHVIRHVR